LKGESLAEDDPPPRTNNEMIRQIYDAVFDKKDGLCVRVERIETYFKIVGAVVSLGVPIVVAIIAIMLH
jgi:hypothetical protein